MDMRQVISVGLFLAIYLSLTENASARNERTIKENAEKACRNIGRGIYQAGNHWCCKCAPGLYKASDCSHGLPDSTQCQGCPFDSESNTQTFMKVENNATECFKALQVSVCNDFMNTEYIIGNSTENGRCQCKEGHFAGEGGIKFGCHKHGECAPGFHPHKLGTKTRNTLCVKCPHGTFSDVYSATAACLPWRKCDVNQIESRKGNGTADTYCKSNESADSFFEEVTTPMISFAFNSTSTVTVLPQTTAGHENHLVLGVALPVLLIFSLAFAVLGFICCWCKTAKRQQDDLKTPPTSDDEVPPEDSRTEQDMSYGSVEEGKGPESQHLLNDEDSRSTIVVDIDENTMSAQLKAAKKPEASENTVATCDGISNVRNKDHPDSNCQCQNQTCSARHFSSRYKESFSCKCLTNLLSRGIENCCLDKAFKDHDIGKCMMESLQQYSLIEMKQYVRKFLREVDITDAEHDAHFQADATRRGWIRKIMTVHGRKLTPEFLYETGFTVEDIKDVVCDVFKKKVEKCH